MNRETRNSNLLDGLHSINTIGDEDFLDIPLNMQTTNENEKNFIKQEIIKTENIKTNEQNEVEIGEIKNNDELTQEKEFKVKEESRKENLKNEDLKEELKKEQIKKKEQLNKEKNENKEVGNGDEDENEDEDDDETIIEKKMRKIKEKFVYSIKDDIFFMVIPKEKISINLCYYFILFIIFTSISIISDIFSIIISYYKGQIFYNIITIFLRLFFISSNIITFKYEFEAIILFQLIINNFLFFSNVCFSIFLTIHHNLDYSKVFIVFCYLLCYISIGCNFINIIFLYIKYYKVYASMTENDKEYLKIYNKRNITSTEIQLIEK